MKHSAELIVLAVTKVRENALVVHTLSREWGRRGFIVRPGKKTSPALFLPLNIIEADITENPKSDLWSMGGVWARDSLSGIRGNLRKNTMTMFLAEVLFRTLRDGSFEDGLYEWCVKNILTLDALEGDFSNFHLLFLLGLAGALGFKPTFDDIAPFAGENLQHIKSLLILDYGEAMLLPLSGEVRNSICENLISYLEYHTEQSINIRSLAVLRELYR